MKVLVTGGAGYLGSVLSTRLLEKGWEVRVLDNFMYGSEAIDHIWDSPNLEIINGDMRDLRTVAKALNNVDVVIHLASIVGDQAANLDPKTTVEINHLTARALAGLCGLYGKRLLYASTCSVYGDNPNGIMSEDSGLDQLKPLSLYGETKVKSEMAISEEVSDFAILRLGTLFGLSYRMRFDLAINLFIAKAINNEKIIVFGGKQYRPFLHVLDAAEAFILALEGGWRGVFNVSWKNWKLLDIAHEIRRYFPSAEIETSNEIVDKRNYQVTCKKVEKMGFKPRKNIEDAVIEISKAFDDGLILDYTLPKYSNYKMLFESEEVRKKVYVLGPIGEKT